MKTQIIVRGGLRHRFARFLFSGAAAVSATPASAANNLPDRDDFPSTDGVDDVVVHDDANEDRVLGDSAGSGGGSGGRSAAAYRLAHMNPFDATHFAALAALDPNARVRRELAEALTSRFRLVGDGFVLDHLIADRDPAVRAAAMRASRVRGYLR